METEDSLSILHVDDDAALGALVETYLEREDSGLDCTVTTETNPKNALTMIRSSETNFDCVVSDYSMPEMNGIDFLEAIRETHQKLPVLLFSGEETGDVAAEIIQAGVTDYLKKSVGTDQYTSLIRRVEHAVDSDGSFETGSEVKLSGVGVIGSDERFERVDETYASFYGYESEELVGKHWSELHPSNEVQHIRTHVIPVVQRGGKWTGQSKGLRADETTFTESKMVTALDGGRMLIAVDEIDDSGLAERE
ncbi:chemotaxis protein CheY [Haloarcula hispanica N601]|uniref:Chemotaxis protein CheY n=4 Tax=Halobacteriales TaxID=2235 RepID=V5TQP8_HALHI|nr:MULTISPECIES: response regulator [Haloarcula]AEM58185.1 HTR-like protein [Haloarcula hispanica ATCC 33960]AHB66924.1 chemotaxis protein CheY [Haloarcula hispanica N601]KAA9410811.1 response regulator [Haloarcula hispanica]KZX47294.1 two-component system response regulator [Haloarcula sp. K1]MUV48834.1 response regulator [Haloarcula sp. CBA1122]